MFGTFGMFGVRITRVIEPGPGSNITDAIDYTIQLANLDETTHYALLFNDKFLRVPAGASASAIHEKYWERVK
jgi:hypothetical protein